MVNRVLIRSKVLQMVYAYYQSENQDLEKAQKEFDMSLEKSYELYHYLLMLIPGITLYAQERIERGLNKYLPTEEDLHPNTRFIDNRLAEQVRRNKDLEHFASSHGLDWSRNEGLFHTLFEQISGSAAYQEYMQAETCDYEADKEVWRRIFKQVLAESPELAQALEDTCIYWNDDLDIVITFVLKTIRHFNLEEGDRQPLLPMFKDADDRNFAMRLFRQTLLNGPQYRELITSSIKNWELERLATMDLLIMQIALTEIMEIEDIPVSVSFNEYIDLAKVFSTEKSSLFINGTLDSIVKNLRAENKLFKS